MSSKNRKVYQMGNRSIREFFSSPTRYLAQAISKESEFEKPYLDDDRGRMHSDLSWPDWPPFGDIPPWPPWSPPDGPVSGLPGCAIVCYDPSNCDEPIWCHPGIWCGSDIGCTLCTWVVEGATSGYTPHPFGSQSWGIDIWIDRALVEEGEALILTTMTDPCGNECFHLSEINCCPSDTTISWDIDNSSVTIARDDNAAVFVLDGSPPYTWTVAGIGFSLLHSETITLNNILVADGSACGVATITVIDGCGDSVVGCLRCTTGSWSNCYLLANPCEGCLCINWTYPIDYPLYRWAFRGCEIDFGTSFPVTGTCGDFQVVLSDTSSCPDSCYGGLPAIDIDDFIIQEWGC